MADILDNKIRTARKDHTCNYCGDVIHKGEKYDYSKLVQDGELYEWKCHLECNNIANILWEYIDPWEGMTEDDFYEGCRDFCRVFICPGCQYADKETYDDLECNLDKSYCLNKITEKLKYNDFRKVKRDPDDWYSVWKLFPKEANK